MDFITTNASWISFVVSIAGIGLAAYMAPGLLPQDAWAKGSIRLLDRLMSYSIFTLTSARPDPTPSSSCRRD